MGNPAAEKDEDEDEEEEAIRLLHERLFQYLEGRLDPKARISQLQSNMAGERAQHKAEKRKLVRPPPSRRGLPSQPPWSSLLRSPALRTKRHRPHAPPLPPSRPVACDALLRWYLAWQAQENERRAQENEQERKRRLGAEQQLKQESGSMLKMPSQQHPSLNSMPSVRAPARLPRLLN